MTRPFVLFSMVYLNLTIFYAKFGCIWLYGYRKEVKNEKKRPGELSAKLYKDTGCLHINITGPAKSFKFYKKKYLRKVNELVRIINYGNFLIYQREVLFITLVKNFLGIYNSNNGFVWNSVLLYPQIVWICRIITDDSRNFRKEILYFQL